MFSKFGKIAKLDWLFHKTGLLKGRPRGYAFVEYATAAVSPFLPRSGLCAHAPFACAAASTLLPPRQHDTHAQGARTTGHGAR